MRIIDVTYPFLVLFVIYLYQKVQHHDTVIAKIDKNLDMESHCQRETSGCEILNNEGDYKKDDDPYQDTMKENLVHHDETKRDKSINMNSSVSRKASNSKYNKHRHGLDTSLISTYDYRKSFDTAKRINKKKKAMKELRATQRNLFPNSSRKATDKKSVGDDGFKKSKQKQKQDFRERKKQQDRNVKSRKLMDNILNETTTTATTTSCTLTTASFIGYGYSFVETLQYPDHNNTSSENFNLSVEVITDDYAYEVAMGWTLFQKESYDLIIDSNDDYFTSHIMRNTTHVFDYYCVVSYGDGDMNVTINDDVLPTCFEFEVHNLQTDEMLSSDFGSAVNFTMSINNKEKATLTYRGRDTTSVNASFCFDSNNDNVSNQEPFNTVFALDDDYNNDIDTDQFNMGTTSSDVIPNYENDLYRTSCVLTKAEITYVCEDESPHCSDMALDGGCTDTSTVSNDYDYDITWQEIMLLHCRKSCNACLTLPSLEHEIQREEIENITTTFNVSLDFVTILR